MFFQKRLKIGLALGSGGPRGLAHIGIIKILEKNNIPIDYIAGSSAGAIIGGIYAATKNIQQIEKFALDSSRQELLSLFFDPSIKYGIISGQKLENFIKKFIGTINFNQLKIPFAAVATNIETGKRVILDRGNVAKAIRISGSIPVVFQAIKKHRKILVDGGLSDPVPVDVVRKMGADFVIAVDLNSYFYNPLKNSKIGFYKIINNTIGILMHNLSQKNIQNANFIVAAKTENIDWSTIIFKTKRKEAIMENEKLMQRLIPNLLKEIKRKSRFIKIKSFVNNLFKN